MRHQQFAAFGDHPVRDGWCLAVDLDPEVAEQGKRNREYRDQRPPEFAVIGHGLIPPDFLAYGDRAPRSLRYLCKDALSIHLYDESGIFNTFNDLAQGVGLRGEAGLVAGAVS